MATLLEMLTGETAQGIIGGVGQLALADQIAGDVAGVGRDARNQLFAAGEQARERLNFKPFTITSARGGVSGADAQGNVNLGLSSQEQAIQNQALQQALSTLSAGGSLSPELQQQLGSFSGLFNQTAGQYTPDITSATQNVYEQLRSIQSPEEERARLALESRLANQGRLGVTTSMFGGTPEQLALEKAIQENMGAASLQARQQALSEQDQVINRLFGLSDATLGLTQAQQQLQQGNISNVGGLLGLGYAPEQQALAGFQPALSVADIEQALRRQGVTTESQLQQSGIQSLLQGQQLGTELQGTTLANLIRSATTPDDAGDTLLSSIISGGADWVSGLFGGE